MKNKSSILRISSTGIPVRGDDIDTDRIIPARFMKVVTFKGLGKYVFYDVRFNNDGSKKDHVFNQKAFCKNTILIANKNFGCGSSREHAPQALYDYGIRALIAESYSEIFSGNCTSMGIPAVCTGKKEVESIMSIIENKPKTKIIIDLENKTLSAGTFTCGFSIPENQRLSLTRGTWDTTSILLEAYTEIEKIKKSLPYLNKFYS